MYRSYSRKGHKKHAIGTNTRALYYQFPLEKRKRGLTEKQFLKMIKGFYDKIADEIINENWTYPLGFGMGKLQVLARKAYYKETPFQPDGNLSTGSRRVNFTASEAYWKEHPEKRKKVYIYHTFENTGGWTYKVYWDKRTSKIINACLYSFKAARNFNIKLGYAINEKHKDYFTKKLILK